MRTVLLVVVTIVGFAAAVNALAESLPGGDTPVAGAEAPPASAQPYREGPLAARRVTPPPAIPNGVAEGAALVALLGVGLGLRWADRTGASRRVAPPRPQAHRLS